MSVRFHFLDALRELPELVADEIQAELHAAESRIHEILPLEQVDILVVPGGFSVIPEYGIGGIANGAARLTLTIDPTSERLEDAERSARLLGSLAHEWHHVARIRTGQGWSTLGAALVTEGLAQCFEEEVGCPTPFYANALSGEGLATAAQKAAHALSDQYFEHDAWFFGKADDPGWPRHGGYSLGYAVVRAWLDHSSDLASSAVGVSADEVLGAWRRGDLKNAPPYS